jgi:signal transduction histidine kinase
MVSRDITERKKSEEELEHSRGQLQKFSEHLENILDEERKRISREIHDELGQILTILKFDVSWLKLNTQNTDPAISEKIDTMSMAVTEALGSVKRISQQLRPPQLDALGICGAIQWDINHMQNKIGLLTSLKIDPVEFVLDKQISMALYRVFHEALTNIVRHAKAQSVSVELSKKAEMVELIIQDDGRGIRKTELRGSGSLGLVGMRERVRQCQGTLSIMGRRGRGTTVTVQIPLKKTRTEGIAS